MKRNYFVVMFFFVVMFSSCIKESDWGEFILPSSQILMFSSPDPFDGLKDVVIPIGDGDTIFLDNMNARYRISYLRAAFPERDISIKYIKRKDDKLNDLHGKDYFFEVRFINLDE